ncbi:hypothetical protein BDF14DRAFT_1785154 [Spinellus fusiger]|nr:hypothetical protein BDF14DRAFT_1785154 [Spinellus fusiger]
MWTKQLDQVRVTLSPFNAASKSTRLFLYRINTDTTRKLNPMMKITTQVMADPATASHISVVYRDGKTLSMATDSLKINHVLQVIGKHAKKLEEAEQAKAW